MSDDENFAFWQAENKAWYDECVANPPEKEDILLLSHWDDGTTDGAVCDVEWNDFSELEYEVPAEGI